MKKDAYEKYVELLEILGSDDLLEQLALALGDYELEDYMNFIARMNDIDFEDEESEENEEDDE